MKTKLNPIDRKNVVAAVIQVGKQGGQLRTGKCKSEKKSMYDLPLFEDKSQTNLF